MKVKLFDEEDEGDLEDDINDFLNDNIEVIDIKYEVAILGGLDIFTDAHVQGVVDITTKICDIFEI